MHSLDPESPEQDEREIRLGEISKRYSNLFGTEQGRLVLGDILTTFHFGESLDPDNPVRVAEYNAGLLILAKTGFLDVIKLELGMGR
jgi:hypothetical protein